MRNFFVKYSKVFIAILVVFGLVAIGAAVFYGRIYYQEKIVNKDVLAVVGDKKITTAELDQFTDDITVGTEGFTVNESTKIGFMNTLVENEIYKNAAVRLKITATEVEIRSKAKEISPEYLKLEQKYQAKVLENARLEIIKVKVEEVVITKYYGKFVVVRYDKYHQDMLNGTDAQNTAQKALVKPVAEELYNLLKSGKITYEEALKRVEASKEVGLSTYPGSLPSQGGLGGEVSTSVTQFPDFAENVKGMKKGDTKLFSVKVQTVDKDGTHIFRDGAFIIFTFEKAKEGEAMGIRQWLDDQYTKLKIRKYDEKIN